MCAAKGVAIFIASGRHESESVEPGGAAGFEDQDCKPPRGPEASTQHAVLCDASWAKTLPFFYGTNQHVRSKLRRLHLKRGSVTLEGMVEDSICAVGMHTCPTEHKIGHD
eukprot:1159504-Pelagomonas_calceolata.AAC.8